MRTLVAGEVSERASELVYGQLQVSLKRRGVSMMLELPTSRGATERGITHFNVDPTRIPPALNNLKAGSRLMVRLASPRSSSRPEREKHQFRRFQDEARYGEIGLEFAEGDGRWIPIYHGAKKIITMSPVSVASLWQPLQEAYNAWVNRLGREYAHTASSKRQTTSFLPPPEPQDIDLRELSATLFPVERLNVIYVKVPNGKFRRTIKFGSSALQETGKKEELGLSKEMTVKVVPGSGTRLQAILGNGSSFVAKDSLHLRRFGGDYLRDPS
ncbi:hypothetical protein A4X09_0g7572, partial [Tilletia walkeri]